MYIQNVLIEGFRNLCLWKGDFSQKSTIIYGRNGAGKTSILEAMYVLGIGKSFRESNKKRMIGYDFQSYKLNCTVFSKSGSICVENFFDNKTSIKIYDKICTLSDIQKYYVPMFFSSEYCHNILSNSQFRRKFFDRLIFGLDSLYLSVLLRYNRTIQQKNQLLKHFSGNKELESWNRVLCDMIVSINRSRKNIIDNLNVVLKKKVGDNLHLVLNSSIPMESEDDVFDYLMSSINVEKKYRTSVFGPHRDKFEILNAKGLSVSTNSSGEKKVLLFFLYLSFFELFFSIREEYPVFLIDDFDAALDDENKKILFSLNNEMQIIASSVNKYSHFDKALYLNKENSSENGKSKYH